MSKKILATIILVILLIIAIILIYPAIVNDVKFLPQDVRDSFVEAASSAPPDVPIEWK